MIKVIDNVFADTFKDYSVKRIGKKVYIALDNDRRVELSFYDVAVKDNYSSMRLELYHKANGKLHSEIVRFSDIFSCMEDLTHPNKLRKYVWYNGGKYFWYGKPTKEDIEKLNKVLRDYIDLWK